MTNKISFVLSVISVALLQACGGGGGDSDSMNVSSTGSAGTSTSSTSSTSTNTGSVSATFNRSATARYHLTNAGGQVFGRLDASVQETNGAMTTLGSNVLSGSKVVKEISGDATYALGRWTAGTVTNSSGAATLTGADNKAYHYIAFNVPSALPTSGTLTCDAGVFSAPTYASGGVGNGAFDSGAASGAVTLTFGSTGASVGGNINVTAAGSSGSIALKASGVTVNGSSISGNYLSNGAGAYLQVGDAGAGAYLVVGSYAVSLANGALYIGAARFRCS
ncbi:hypothetical protein ABID77_002526 [Variovorax sp. PvP013]